MTEPTFDLNNAFTYRRPSTAAVVAWSMLLLFVLTVLLLFFVKVPAGNDGALNIVLGAIIGYTGTIVAYFFGDSKKSQQKDDTITTLASKAPPP
jgi:cadmium resistance protein CadD (predicted permease)